MIIVRKVVGHSMLPVLPPSTNIVALRLLRKPKIGTVVVLRHEGKEKIKRVHKTKDNQIFVVGDNSSASTDSNDFGWIPKKRIIGRVVWPTKLHKKDI